MAHHLYHLKEKIRYRVKARHHKGFGIHSPYLFHLISSVLQGRHPYYCFGRIETKRQEFNLKPLLAGHPSFVTKHKYRKKAHNRQIIFRIIQDARFRTLLELGTSSGIETQYMALANQKARCITVTKSAGLADAAKKGFQEQGLDQIELHLLKPQDTLSKFIDQLENLDFVLFNQLESPGEEWTLFQQCLVKKNDSSIFVFMNIHENPAKARVWKDIRNSQDIQVAIDLFDLGIVLFNPELEKRKYVIRTK